ncbi:MAG: nucleotidyltransferase [Chthonomonadetes bacterium]|nr:nucleotidyltransferase [Chthonomonadetes bacterium]
MFLNLLKSLAEHNVEYILIGGMAGVLHGSARLTQDMDILYQRTPQNIQRLVDALAPYRPYLRDAPEGLPFIWDARTVQRGLNFTLHTTEGYIDLWAEVPGGGTYENLINHTVQVEIAGTPVRVVDLETLIRLKRATGRPKDLESVAELEALLEERQQKERPAE